VEAFKPDRPPHSVYTNRHRVTVWAIARIPDGRLIEGRPAWRFARLGDRQTDLTNLLVTRLCRPCGGTKDQKYLSKFGKGYSLYSIIPAVDSKIVNLLMNSLVEFKKF